MGVADPKSAAMPLTFWLITKAHQRFLKVLHISGAQRAAKLQAIKLCKIRFTIQKLSFFILWPVTSQLLEAQGCVLPFWKPLMCLRYDPDGQGGGSTFRVYQALLKMGVL